MTAPEIIPAHGINTIMPNVSLYIIPPILSLVVGLFLAALSLVKGKLKRENVLLSVICVWWTLLSWAFICHHLIDDEQTLLAIERGVHCLYVFIPAVTLLFFQIIMNRRWNVLVIVCFGISAVLSVFTFTDYYFYGFYRYSWGLIAKNGAAFRAFSLYATVVTVYIFIFVANKIRGEKNPVNRVKYKYLFLAYCLSALMTMTNIPATNGIDVYPLSNFLFIPLAILTYGILRHQLMDIRSVLHITTFWFILSSLIVIPNITIFLLLRPHLLAIHPVFLFLIFIVWFLVNYFYFNRIQPVIDQLFNRRSYNLGKVEAGFIEDISVLKNLDELVNEVELTVKRGLHVERAVLYIKRGFSKHYRDIEENTIFLGDDIEALLLDRHSYLERSFVETSGNYHAARDTILTLFETLHGEYLIPLINNGELLGVLLLSEKTNLKRLNEREITFVHNITAYAAIALANSTMYQNLSDLKDNLERMVMERTAIIEKQKSELEKDILLAQEIQLALLPQNIPDISAVEIAYKYVPIMGVGGDFIDIHYRRGMKELGLFICDVSGHGVGSALVASMVKMSLNSWGKFIQRPAEALREMKTLLKGKMGGNFITACICCLDIESGTLISANAGHPPMLLVRSGGDIDMVRSKGRVFLDFAEPDYEDAKNYLKRGDKIVLYTDGITEARNAAGALLGEEQFVEILKHHAGYPAREMCQAVYDEILNFTGPRRSFEDDFALLVAEYKG